MQYTLTEVKSLTSKAGKPFKKALANGEDVSIWPDYSHYNEAVEGATLEAIIQTNGNYKNLKDELAPPKFISQNRGAGMAKAQETKAKYIEQAQERKTDAICYFNSLNSAISLVVGKMRATGQIQTNNAILVELRNWREIFLAEYEHYRNPSIRQLDYPEDNIPTEMTSDGNEMPTF